MGMDDSNLLVQCDFEVFGHVQGMEFWAQKVQYSFGISLKFIHTFFMYFCIWYSGVGFTKICRDNCANADIRGWVKNSKRGTIIGKMQGVKTEVDKM